ncbi:polynucleotide kinase [Thalassospira sp. UBA1131]|uniref:phosphatase domain-containing protein n=1 Tax=Thalassospira sp. UBA1131 TaxID=1947672 RepID=UPI0025EBC6C7|nr:polynucleotide kinase [Thalassospira sp. UBA1131]
MTEPKARDARDAVVFDMDGTLAHFDADALGHLVHGVEKQWDAFFDAMDHAKPIENIEKLLRILHASGHAILICSGRPAGWQHRSEAWLRAHDIPFDGMYLRPMDADHRTDEEVKEYLLAKIIEDGFNPWLVVDDRRRVVDKWRDMGLTCLQCAPGDF